MSNRVKLNIYGTDYTIVSSESKEYMEEMGYEIDKILKTIMNSDSSMSITNALVLCTLTYLDSANKEKGNGDHLREQLQEYLSDANKKNDDLNQLNKELSAMRKENQQLKAQLLASGMPGEDITPTDNTDYSNLFYNESDNN